MMLSSNTYFLHTISHLRSQEEMLIYDRWAPITVSDERATGDFLREEYDKEMTTFPGAPPPFAPEAAIWGARIIFNASQLLLSREKDEKDILQLSPPFGGKTTPAAILSIDLCLRCLPDVIAKADELTPDDPLIPLLEEILRHWHYSGVGYFRQPDDLDWAPVLADACVLQLYINRVIDRRVSTLASLSVLRPGVMAALGDHHNYFWKEL